MQTTLLSALCPGKLAWAGLEANDWDTAMASNNRDKQYSNLRTIRQKVGEREAAVSSLRIVTKITIFYGEDSDSPCSRTNLLQLPGLNRIENPPKAIHIESQSDKKSMQVAKFRYRL